MFKTLKKPNDNPITNNQWYKATTPISIIKLEYTEIGHYQEHLMKDIFCDNDGTLE